LVNTITLAIYKHLNLIVGLGIWCVEPKHDELCLCGEQINPRMERIECFLFIPCAAVSAEQIYL
ncbi:hypothetical protein L0N33_22850, partial [Roseburia faecis]|nr:hypothetical protein [Roseburia faecis]